MNNKKYKIYSQTQKIQWERGQTNKSSSQRLGHHAIDPFRFRPDRDVTRSLTKFLKKMGLI